MGLYKKKVVTWKPRLISNFNFFYIFLMHWKHLDLDSGKIYAAFIHELSEYLQTTERTFSGRNTTVFVSISVLMYGVNDWKEGKRLYTEQTF